MNARWLSLNGVKSGPFCTAQGVHSGWKCVWQIAKSSSQALWSILQMWRLRFGEHRCRTTPSVDLHDDRVLVVCIPWDKLDEMFDKF